MSEAGYAIAAPAAAVTAPAAPAEDYDPDKLTKRRKEYREWSDLKVEERKEQRTARHYYHSDQWTESQLKTLNKRKQPPVVYNRTARKIDGIVGLVGRLRQDPKAYPRTPQHEQGAELATAALRYSLDEMRWSDKESEPVRDSAIEGTGVVEMQLVAGDQGDPELNLDIVDQETVFYDPRSYREDFSDARYFGVAKWVDVEVAKEMFPEAAERLDGLIAGSGDFAAMDQQDRERSWTNVERKRVRLADHWYIEGGEWRWCVYTSDLALAFGDSPFHDEKGKSFCKFIAFSAYVDHDGDRYGFPRNLKGPQDEINMRRSKALHQLNTRRIIATKGAVENVEKARLEAARPDGYIELNPQAVNGGRFEFEDAQKQAEFQGQMEMLAEAKAEIESFGPTPPQQATGGADARSGRALALLQQSGIAELGPFMGSYKGWKLRIYRSVWNAMQEHWTAERWIRVTDDQGAAQFVQLNGIQMDPQTGQPVMVNSLGALDVDIIIDEGPDTVTVMADVYETLQSLAAAGVPVPPQVIIETSNLPDSQKKKINGMIEKANQADPMQEQAKQVALAGEAAKVDETKSKTALNTAKVGAEKAGVVKDFVELLHEGMKPDPAEVGVVGGM